MRRFLHTAIFAAVCIACGESDPLIGRWLESSGDQQRGFEIAFKADNTFVAVFEGGQVVEGDFAVEGGVITMELFVGVGQDSQGHPQTWKVNFLSDDAIVLSINTFRGTDAKSLGLSYRLSRHKGN